MHSTPHQQGARWPARGPVRVLLLLDDQPELTRLVEAALLHVPFVLLNATSLVDAAAALATWQPHVVLADVDLAEASLLEHASARAPGGKRLPAIGLMHGSDLQTKLAAFEAGLDDVLCVPFAPQELLARVVALVRRSYSDVGTFTPAIKAGDLEIDILNRTVWAGPTELRLTAMEQSLLYLLASNAGRIVSREEILDTLWGTNYVADSNVVDRQIGNLRARLHDDWKQPRFISTVPGRGYKFLPAEDAPEADSGTAASGHT